MFAIRPTGIATISLVVALLVLATDTCMPQKNGQVYQRQQQQQNQPPPVESTSPTKPESVSYGLSAQENRIEDEHAARPALKGSLPEVINGNHATYVKPPANFVPIIYKDSQVSLNTDTTGNTIDHHQLHQDGGTDAEFGDELNPSPLKPSIDRWSGWHDMSDDPDFSD